MNKQTKFASAIINLVESKKINKLALKEKSKFLQSKIVDIIENHKKISK